MSLWTRTHQRREVLYGSVTARIDFLVVSAGTYQALISEVTLSPDGQVTNCAWESSVPFTVKKVSLKKPTLAPDGAGGRH